MQKEIMDVLIWTELSPSRPKETCKPASSLQRFKQLQENQWTDFDRWKTYWSQIGCSIFVILFILALNVKINDKNWF